MAAFFLSFECSDSPIRLGPYEFPHTAEHGRCPGGQIVPGVLGGWRCSCPCHHRQADTESET